MKGIVVNDISIDYLDKKISDLILESSKELLKDYIKAVWPAATADGADKHCINPSYLTLLPLQRVGAPEGASGAKVMVAYFNNESPLWCSKPLILKYDFVEPGKRDKLQEEKDNYDTIEPFIREFESSFAAPIHLGILSTHPEFRCLWSPFLSTVFSVDDRSKGMRPEENDLWKFLTSTVPALDEKKVFEEFEKQLKDLFDAIYNYLRPMHDRFGMAEIEPRNLIDLYKKYLRNYPKWIKRWESIWGIKQHIKGSKARINPIYVFNRLIEMNYSVRIGAVHGDLHPKNVLLDSFKRPQIIDFGWSSDKAHILIDFTLMEANLRFVTLHNPVPETQLESLSQLLTIDDLTSKIIDKSLYIDFIRKSILNIRHKAKKIFNDSVAENDIINNTSFEKEYAISLFLISFGLLRHIENFKNQPATKRTVETLAQHVYELLLK